MSSRWSPLWVATMGLAAIASLAGCPREGEVTPPIAVSPGVAWRVGLLARRAGVSGERAGGDAGPESRARAHVMARGEELRGTNAVGRPGDIVLENDEVVFVIDRLGTGAGFAESGGNIVDAADAKVRKDELGQLFSYFGRFPRQGVYDRLTFREESDGGALVEARGHELTEPKLAVVTTYHLAGSDRALLLRTDVTNTGNTPVTLPGVGDAIQWGFAEKLAPGKERGFRGKSSGSFIGGVGRETSYAITSTEGRIDAVSGESWSDTVQEANVTLPPGVTKTYDRVFLVGARGDTASLVAELAKSGGAQVGALRVALHAASCAGPPVAAPLGARVSVRAPDGHEVATLAATGAAVLEGELPPGKYLVTYAGGAGRRGVGPAVGVTVVAGRVAEADVAVSEPGALSFTCEDATTGASLPCKATLTGEDRTPTPDLGVRHQAGPARNRVTTETGRAEVALAPGTYTVTLSRGPEYTAPTARVVVSPGATATVNGKLARVVDTAGYLACDLHQHSMLGADAPVAQRDRVISNAVEGVELAMTTEHNLVADLSGVVRDLALSAYLVHVPGDEVTTDAQVTPFGHLNVFPLAVDATKPRGGAFAVRGKSAAEVIQEARARGPVVVQVNHPRSGNNGYFDRLKFDPAKGRGEAPGYAEEFDAVEVWNGRDLGQRARCIDDYFALLRTSHPVTPTANTDTHGIVGQEPGYPRTLVRARDGDLAGWDAGRTSEIVTQLRAGRDVVLTNGPFLRVTVEGKSPGEVARVPASRVVAVKVHVEAPTWVDVRTVSLRSARVEAGPSVDLRQAKDAAGNLAFRCDAAGRCRGDVTLRLRVEADDAVAVFATGERELREVMDGEGPELRPFAMTSAVFLDADGDDRALGVRAR
ncbi:MAG: CehA/McbA family metallohydrolase [Myxococcales bacterium]|nr:CehA/McbA family metallohydrolase [Myxococcales bacterium]